jgi:hypothetical protein
MSTQTQEKSPAIIEPEETQVTVVKPAQSMDSVMEMAKTLQDFVGKALVEKEDYGKIPGCGQKPTLLKPGAEKLANFFGLASKMQCVQKVENYEDGFFMYTFKASVYSLKRPDVILSECEGSCNSREKKYINQSPYNIINTLQKMAQKRAFVGAVILATRASHKFTQDLEDMSFEEKSQNNGNQKSLDDSFVFKFGPYKGRKIGELTHEELFKAYQAINGEKSAQFKARVKDYGKQKFGREAQPGQPEVSEEHKKLAEDICLKFESLSLNKAQKTWYMNKFLGTNVFGKASLEGMKSLQAALQKQTAGGNGNGS